MTPQVAARLTIHEPDAVDADAIIGRSLALGGMARARAQRRVKLIEGSKQAIPALQRREALQRRLLAFADLLGATAALWLAIAVPANGDRPALLLFAAMPTVILLVQDRRPLRPRPAPARPLDARRGARCCSSSRACSRSP